MINNELVSIGGSKRLAYLDAIKCFAILLVISGHVQFFGMDLKDSYASPGNLMLYSFKMPLFFFVSGYLAFKENAFGTIGELKKLGTKFLFLVVPAIVFYCFLNFSKGSPLFEFLKSGLGGYWFTFTLFEIFVIYYALSAMSRSKVVLASLLALVSIAGVGYLSFFSKYEIPFLDFNHLSKYFQYFALGVFAKMYIEQYDRLMRNEYLKAFSMVSFFVLLFSLYQISMPSVVFHFLRDIVLRYLGLYVVVSLFYCNQDFFNRESKLNSLMLKIGQNSLAIYLLQYFFMPDFSAYPVWLQGLDWVSVYAISFAYTVFITAICMIFIELLSNSMIVKKYVLGKK